MTHANFDDYPKNGEGLSVYEPCGERHLYPAGTELIFHVSSDAAYLDNADVERLRDVLDAHLERTHLP